MTEEELASKCKLADNQARKELYELYGGSLMAICLRYIGDREAAEDVLHDGFVRIFQSIGQFTYQGVGSLKAWLSRVMVNEALGYLRKRNQLAQQEVLMEHADTERMMMVWRYSAGGADEDDCGTSRWVSYGIQLICV
mgnify:CR=1 FL=1